MAGQASLTLPRGNLHSRASNPFSPTRGEWKTHTRRTWPLIPGTWAKSTQVFPRDFQRLFFFSWRGGDRRKAAGRKADCLPAEPTGPVRRSKGTKGRASWGPSYLLNGPGPVQKREDARASPEGGRVVPKQPDQGPWDLSPGACGGPTPKKPALRDPVM